MTTFVGISGPIGSGKSTFASMLQEALGDELATTLHSADPLKKICSEAFKIPLNHFYDRELKERPFQTFYGVTDPIVIEIENLRRICELAGLPFSDEIIRKHEGVDLISPRNVAQYVGTDIMRSLDSDIHVNNLLALGRERRPRGIVLVPDVRFENEHAVMNANLYVYRSKLEPLLPQTSGLHESERALPFLKDNSFRIWNDGTLLDLRNQALDIAAQWKRFLEFINADSN